MDPKMDSGFLAPGETLYDTYDVLQDLLPEEVIGIMDQLLCYEVCVLSFAQRDAANLMIDGMASRLSAVPNALHISLHRKHPLARPKIFE